MDEITNYLIGGLVCAVALGLVASLGYVAGKLIELFTGE
jgi:hypothetical protein